MKAQSNGAVRLGPSFACGHEVPACFKYAVTDVRRTKTVREADIAACVMIAMRLGGQHSTEDASPAGLLAQRQAEVVTGVLVDAAIGPGADDKGVKDEIRSAAADQDERQEIGADDFEKGFSPVPFGRIGRVVWDFLERGWSFYSKSMEGSSPNRRKTGQRRCSSISASDH